MPRTQTKHRSNAVILRQEIGPLPIDDLSLGFLFRVDVELVKDHHFPLLPVVERPHFRLAVRRIFCTQRRAACPQRFIITGRKPFVLAVLSSQAFSHLALRSVSICRKTARGETENEQETKHFLEMFTVKTSYDVLLSLAAKPLSTASTE